MFTSYWIIGALSLLFLAPKRKNNIQKALPATTGSTLLILKCNSIQVVNKTGLHNYFKNEILKYFKRKGLELNQFEQVDFNSLFLEILEKISKICYNKYMQRKLTSQEKIVMALFFHEIYLSFSELINGAGLNVELLDNKLYTFSQHLTQWMDAEKESQDFEEIYNKFKTSYKYP